MNQEAKEMPLVKWLRDMDSDTENAYSSGRIQIEEHPWLARMTETEDEDSLGEILRYALDELRFA